MDATSQNSVLDKVESKVKFGCVLFDFQENAEGRNVPTPNSGWASISGGPAFRIKNTSDLANDVKWVSNLPQEIHWKSGAVRFAKIKHSGYFRTDLYMIVKELGISVQRLTTAKVCEYLSGIFSRIIQVAIEFLGVTNFDEQDFATELKNILISKDVNINNYIDEAFTRSYQDIVHCVKELPKNKKYITLRRPRYLHAQNILSSTIPAFSDSWEVFDDENLPEDFDERKNFLISMKRPFIAKISIEPFEDGKFANLFDLFSLGEATGERGRKVARNWVSQSEFLYLRKFVDIKVHAAFISQNKYEKIKVNKKIPDLGPLSNMSYSLGILSECFWVALASRSVNPLTKTKTLVTPRACWLRCSDRFYTFTSAYALKSAGFTIISYGVGAVTVAVEEKNIKSLVKVAAKAGLVPPLNMFDSFYISSEV